MQVLLKNPQPLKTIHDKRLAYLAALEESYKELGYQTRLDGFNNVLEIHKKEAVLCPLATSQQNSAPVLEKWID